MYRLKSFLTAPDISDPTEQQRLNTFLRGILVFSILITTLATLTLILAGNGALLVCLPLLLYMQQRGWLRRAS